MKEFDLEKAKAGAPIITREGRNARIIGEIKHPKYPLVVAVRNRNGDEEVFLCTNKGQNNLHQVSDEDLFMDSIVHKKYANLYFENIKEKYIVGEVCDTEKEAKSLSMTYGKYIKTIEIEWEE